MANAEQLSDKQLADQRAKYLTGLVWHIGAFVILNVFFWLLDLFMGQDGAQWAYWITGAWALALAFHALAWFVDGRQMQRRRAIRYREEERRSNH